MDFLFEDRFENFLLIQFFQIGLVLIGFKWGVNRGGSRIFSRGGGGADFQKIFQNFDDLFFKVHQIDF